MYFPLCHKKKRTKLLECGNTRTRKTHNLAENCRENHAYNFPQLLFFSAHSFIMYLLFVVVVAASRAFILILVNICLFADVEILFELLCASNSCFLCVRRFIGCLFVFSQRVGVCKQR